MSPDDFRNLALRLPEVVEQQHQPLLKPQNTIRKDHKGHKDRRILTEANEENEGLSNPKPNPGRPPFVALCKISSVFVAFVIFPYCDLGFRSGKPRHIRCFVRGSRVMPLA